MLTGLTGCPMVGDMLKDFIWASRRTRAEVATDLGIGQSYLSELVNGKCTPSLAVAVRIERYTGGDVMAASWVPVEAGR